MQVVEMSGLVKHYLPDVKAVDGVDFTIPKGTIFSIIGPNGAGKTTTVEILEGLRSPTSGTAQVLGIDVIKDYTPVRKRVGISPQSFEPFDMLKPPEAVQYWAELYNMRITRREVDDLTDRVGLSNRKSSVSKKLSGGERRKLGIALLIVNDPELLFLDEPTIGLDPKARRDLWKLIDGIRDKGTTVLLTIHYLDEAEKLSDDVAIMLNGKIVARGSPSDLIAKHGKMTVVVLAGAGKTGLYEVTRRGIAATEENGDVLVPVSDPAEMRLVLAKLASIEFQVKDMYTRKQTLEDVFLNVVGTKMDEGVLSR